MTPLTPRPAVPDAPPADRHGAVVRVLFRVLLLNLVVAGAKLAFGYATGTVSILSDGFHSLTDGSSNVVALVGTRIARRPPDEDHPYGHRKYETMAAVVIAVFLALVMVEVLRTAAHRLLGSAPAPHVGLASFLVMLGTLGVNVWVVRYERREGARLGSEVLRADAMHTQSDLLTSLAVIGALAGTRAGYPILDPLAAGLVAVFIGHAGYQIALEASRILGDQAVFSRDDLREVVMGVSDVLGCEKIRTRGSADQVFLDMHVWFPGTMPLDRAHELSHVVKDRLMARYPQIVDAIIHIEPPPREREGADDEG
ncbi:MAG: cation transporter [Acidobacteriota bacterium]|nr:cation transporter [Acidobacteriota bacterium]